MHARAETNERIHSGSLVVATNEDEQSTDAIGTVGGRGVGQEGDRCVRIPLFIGEQ